LRHSLGFVPACRQCAQNRDQQEDARQESDEPGNAANDQQHGLLLVPGVGGGEDRFDLPHPLVFLGLDTPQAGK
jgi:hypothetical protein